MKSYLPYILLIAGIIIGLSSCGVRYHLKKSEKHKQKAINLGAQIDRDTVWTTMEIPVPYVSTDTIFQASEADTVILEKDRLRVSYVRVRDTVMLSGECLADTIYKEVIHTVIEEIICPPKDNKWKWIALALGAVLIIALVIKR